MVNRIFVSVIMVLMTWSLSAAEEKVKADPAADLYYGANGLYNRKLYSLAADQYQEFIAKYPKHEKLENARLGLGLSQFSIGEYEKAEPTLRTLSGKEKLPQIQQIRLMHAQCLLKLDRLDDATKAFELSTSKAKDAEYKTKSLAGLVETLYQQKKWEEVVTQSDALLNAAGSGGLSERARYQGGMARFELEQFEAASKHLRPFADALKASAFGHHGRFLYGESLRSDGQFAEAAKVYGLAANDESGPYRLDAWFLKGFCEFEAKDFGACSGTLSTFVQKNEAHGSYPRALLTLGRAYLEQKNYSLAAKHLEKAQGIDANALEAGLWLGRTYLAQDNLKKAEQVFSDSLKKPGKNEYTPVLLYDWGNTLVSQKAYSDAVAPFARLANEFSDFPQLNDVLRQLSYCYHKAEKYDEATVQANAFLAKFAGDAHADEVAFIQAESLYLNGKSSEAIKAYTEFVTAYPKSTHVDMAGFRAGQLYFAESKWGQVVSQLEPLIKKNVAGEGFQQVRYMAGAAAYRAEKWEDAVKHLNGFVAAFPKEANADVAALTAAMALDQQQLAPEAVAAFKKMAEGYPQSDHAGHALFELGRLQYVSKEYPSARQNLQRALASKTSDLFKARATYFLGWVAKAEGKLDEAITHFGAVVTTYGDQLEAEDALLQQGMIAYKAGNYKVASEALRAFAAKYPKHEKLDQVLYHAGASYSALKNWAEAIQQFDAVLKKYADSSWRAPALYDWAWCEKGREDQAAAIKKYRELLDAYPEHALSAAGSFELAEELYATEQYADAATLLENLLTKELEPVLAERALFRLGWCYFEQKSFGQAAVPFEKLVAEFPTATLFASAAFQAGECRLSIKEFEPAYEQFKRAADAERKAESGITEQTLLRLGETEALSTRWADSEKSYMDFIARFPSSELRRRADFGLGWARENTGKHAEAMASYQKVVDVGVKDETGARCQFQIGECLLALKQWDNAVKALIQVEVNYAYPEYSSKALLEIGNALKQKGDVEAAKKQYAEVISKYPNTDAARVAREQLGS